MNKTIYVADPAIWNEAAHLAFKYKLSMSALVAKLLKEWMAAERRKGDNLAALAEFPFDRL